MNNYLISREALKKHKVYSLERHEYVVPVYNIDNAPTVEGRMFYVQETVNTILNSCTGNTDIDKAFRNAARLVQNAIDGKLVDFEEIERSEEE